MDAVRSVKLKRVFFIIVIELHAIIYPLRHIHVGCDEVRNLNKCPKCRERKLKTAALYFDHVKEVASIVKKLSPSLKVLVWANYMPVKRGALEIFIHNVDAVAWDYTPKPQLSHTYFSNLHKNFNDIWIATAFKGADGYNATIPNIRRRFQNHISWMKFILGFKFGEEKKVYDFKGIILTGWSRFTHTAPQCELLPIAMPSLVLNLLLIKAVQNGIDEGDLNLKKCDIFKKYLIQDFNAIFDNKGDTDTKCAFENTLLYIEHEELFKRELTVDCLRSLDVNCYNIKTSMNLDKTIKNCEIGLENLLKLKNSLKQFMAKYYKTSVIDSYIHDTIQDPANKISQRMRNAQNCSKTVKNLFQRHFGIFTKHNLLYIQL